MRTRMFYEGKSEDSDYSTFVFVINGKGDWGNGELWNDEEWRVAQSLANYISENTCSPEPVFEGYAVWLCNKDKYFVTEWKEEVKQAYRDWKASNK